jgi:hypothetical protein
LLILNATSYKLLAGGYKMGSVPESSQKSPERKNIYDCAPFFKTAGAHPAKSRVWMFIGQAVFIDSVRITAALKAGGRIQWM